MPKISNYDSTSHKRNLRPTERFSDVVVDRTDIRLEELLSKIDKQLALPVKSEKIWSDLCRTIRGAKIHFYRILDRSGPGYGELAARFVTSVQQSAKESLKAECSSKLKKSLARHAKESSAALEEYFERSAG